MTFRTGCAVILMAVLCAGGGIAGAAQGEHTERVNKGMTLVSVFPGMTRTSTPLTIRVSSSRIPENAVVESVAVVTGAITADRRATAAMVIESYNIKGPSMEAFVPKRWAGKGRATTFSSDELLGGDVPVKGVWQLSMTGNNVGVQRATASHSIRALEFRYRY